MYLRARSRDSDAGDRVAVQMPNCLAYPIAVFGCLKAGLVMVNTNPLYTTAEMAHQFADSEAIGPRRDRRLRQQSRRGPPEDRNQTGRSRRCCGPASTGVQMPSCARHTEVCAQDDSVFVTFDHITFSEALAEGASRIASGTNPGAYQKALTLDHVAALRYTGGTTGIQRVRRSTLQSAGQCRGQLGNVENRSSSAGPK